MLIPEISLTPQTVERFRQRFGESVAVLHSALSAGERYDEWRRIRLSEARVVVGARSAVFAPCENLKLIIIDEAQNLTPHEVKTIISRAGEDTKIVLTGDPAQIDNPYLDAASNGLTYLVDRLKNQPIYGHVTLKKSERSPLAAAAAELL